MIGNHLTSIQEALEKKSWMEMSTEEKIEFGSVAVIISMTIFIFVYLNYWLN